MSAENDSARFRLIAVEKAGKVHLSEGSSPFQTQAWIRSYANTFRTQSHYYILRRSPGSSLDEAVGAISAGWTCEYGFPLRTVSFCGSSLVDHGEFPGLSEEDDLKKLLDQIRLWFPTSVVRLQNLTPDLLQRMSRLGRDSFICRKTEVCVLPLADTWEQQFAQLGRKMRYYLRSLAKVREEHGVSIRVSACTNVNTVVEEILEIESLARKRNGNKKFFVNRERISWFREYIELAETSGEAPLLVLAYARGEPIGYIAGFVRGYSVFFYQTASRRGFDGIGLGHCLLEYAIRHCVEVGVRVFYFGPGNSVYKRKWTGLRITYGTLIIPGGGTRGFLSAAWVRALESARVRFQRLVARETDVGAK